MVRGEPQPVREQLEVALYQVRTAPHSGIRLFDRRFPHWVVSHVLVGEVRTSSAGVEALARAGDVMVHAPQSPFSEIAEGRSVHQWMEFEALVSPRIDLFRLHPVCEVVRLPSAKEYAAAFGALERRWAEPPSPARDLRVTALMADLLGMVLEGWRRAGAKPRHSATRDPRARLRDIVSFMDEHLDDKLTRAGLARRAGVHPGYFDRIFHSAYGVAPMAMLRDLRLRRAQRLLETTDFVLERIAGDCGLGDAAYLSRVFRARFGVTPGAHRENALAARQAYVPPPDAPTT